MLLVLLWPKAVATLIRPQSLTRLRRCGEFNANSLDDLSFFKEPWNSLLIVPGPVAPLAHVEGGPDVHNVEPDIDDKLGEEVEDVKEQLGRVAR